MKKTSIKGAIQELSGKAGKPTMELAGKALKAAQKALADAQAAYDFILTLADETADALALKVDKEDGKGLSTNDYTTAEKTKLAGIAEGANNYQHPATHPATIMTEDETHRFATDAEKATWNAKSDLALGETNTTAYRGDRGKTAYDHSQSTHAPSSASGLLDAIKGVDGPGSGLDADTLDGTHLSAIALLAGIAMQGDFNANGHALRNETTITTENGNTYETYPLGISWSSISTNCDQTTGEDFPVYGTLLTVKISAYRMFQILVQHSEARIWVRAYYNTGFTAWRRIPTADEAPEAFNVTVASGVTESGARHTENAMGMINVRGIYAKTSPTAGSYNHLATVPTDLIPSETVWFTAAVPSSDGALTKMGYVSKVDGKIYVWYSSSAQSENRLNITYQKG